MVFKFFWGCRILDDKFGVCLWFFKCIMWLIKDELGVLFWCVVVRFVVGVLFVGDGIEEIDIGIEFCGFMFFFLWKFLFELV